MRGSRGFNAAAELIRDRLNEYGLDEVEIISLPADGTIFYGTQRSRPAWNAGFAELWEQSRRAALGRGDPHRLLGRAADQPRPGQRQRPRRGRAGRRRRRHGGGDYAGKEVRGKLVLASSQPARSRRSRSADMAPPESSPGRRTRSRPGGARMRAWSAGAISTPGSIRPSPSWSRRHRRGPGRRGWARRGGAAARRVEAGREPGAYLIPTAVIPGSDRDRRSSSPAISTIPIPAPTTMPAAAPAILEIARGLRRLVQAAHCRNRERTIRFVWPAEIEATIALLNARPEFQRRRWPTSIST